MAAAFLRRQWALKRGLLRAARDVQARTGKSVLRQVLEIARLRRGPGQLRAGDYYLYGVYDDARLPPAAKGEYVSWDRRRVPNAFNDPSWSAVCDDKLLFYALMRGLGFHSPDIYAVYDRRGRTFGGAATFASADRLIEHLRSEMPYPFFGKPVRGSHGDGAAGVVGFDRARDRLILREGEEVAPEEYVRRFVAPAGGGYLFQEPLRQHEALDRITGGRVGTLRVIVLRDDGDPRLFRASWRIPVGRSATDNFHGGRGGNLVAHLDRTTGRVERVVQAGGGDGAGGPRSVLEVEAHPDSGERILGTVIPDWPRVAEVCRRAASAVPGLRYQAWDIAIGPDGPLLMELNFRPGHVVLQVHASRGLFDPELQDFWARHGRRRAGGAP